MDPKCRDTRFYPIDVYEDCLCDTYIPVAIGNWSECILEPEETFYRSPRLYPGKGMCVGEISDA